MGRIAVDVVLLPDETMAGRAIRMSRQIAGQSDDQIVLNERDCLPHISLAMGCIGRDGIRAVQDRLRELARERPVTQLTAVGIAVAGSTLLLEIEKTDELQVLHEAVMREMDPLFSHHVTTAMIRDEVVTDSTLEWIREYPRKAAFERFAPHITLGYGTVTSEEPFPIPFAVSALALCHLGNHCTCREVLGEWNIGIVE